MSSRDGAGVSGKIDFFEVHAENFMASGGPALARLDAVRERRPISLHGVCLSLGGLDELDMEHLRRLKTVVDRYDPALVSEHLAWCAHSGVFFNDLVAPPLSHESLKRTAAHISQTQDFLGRQILVENPSRYLPYEDDLDEPEFLDNLARESGCGLLLDINNVYVSAQNLGYDAASYISAINANAVGEIHLAGHSVDERAGLRLLIDDHSGRVCEEVADLYRGFIRRAGPVPTLFEWDTDTPGLSVLSVEAEKIADWMADSAPQSEINKTDAAPPAQANV